MHRSVKACVSFGLLGSLFFFHCTSAPAILSGRLLSNNGGSTEQIHLVFKDKASGKVVGETDTTRYGFFTITGNPDDIVPPSDDNDPISLSACAPAPTGTTPTCVEVRSLTSDCVLPPLSTSMGNTSFCVGGIVPADQTVPWVDPVPALERDGIVPFGHYTVMIQASADANTMISGKWKVRPNVSLTQLQMQVFDMSTNQLHTTINLDPALAAPCDAGYVCFQFTATAARRFLFQPTAPMGQALPLSALFESVRVNSARQPTLFTERAFPVGSQSMRFVIDIPSS